MLDCSGMGCISIRLEANANPMRKQFDRLTWRGGAEQGNLQRSKELAGRV
jgi:hypothetical protein